MGKPKRHEECKKDPAQAQETPVYPTTPAAADDRWPRVYNRPPPFLDADGEEWEDNNH